MSDPDQRLIEKLRDELAQARAGGEGTAAVFEDLRAALGITKASELWWACFGAYDAAET